MTKRTEDEWTAIYGYEYIVPLSHKDRPVGASVDPHDDEHHYAQVIARVTPDDPYGRGTQKAHADLIVSAPTLQTNIDYLEAASARWSDALIASDNKIKELEAEKAELIEFVQRQAEDEGLWFFTEDVTVAYLQQELRRLHAVIERGVK